MLKEIDNFVTLCIGNEEKIRFYFEQRDDITLEDIAQYELNKDNLPSTKSSLGCSKNFQLHNVFSSSNVDKGNEEVYIISDNENDRDGTAERSSSRYNITKRLKSGRAVADSEATSDDDFDWNSDSYDYVDTSDEEAYPRPCKKPKVAEKRKQLKV